MTKLLFLIVFMLSTIQIMTQDSVLIFGHRGCRGLLPENTIIGFNHAISLGVDGIEWDVVINKDKEVVVSHDPYMKKDFCLMPDGSEIKDEKSLNIFQMSQSEITQYDCGTKVNSKYPEQKSVSASKPLLKEVLNQVNLANQTILFEIKSELKLEEKFYPSPKEYVSIILQEIAHYEYKKQVIFMSFDARIINEIHKKAPEYKTVYLTYSPFKSVSSALKDLNHQPYALGMYHPTISEKDIKKAHSKNVQIFGWTVNELEKAQKLTQMGIDGIITDYPDRINSSSVYLKKGE